MAYAPMTTNPSPMAAQKLQQSPLAKALNPPRAPTMPTPTLQAARNPGVVPTVKPINTLPAQASDRARQMVAANQMQQAARQAAPVDPRQAQMAAQLGANQQMQAANPSPLAAQKLAQMQDIQRQRAAMGLTAAAPMGDTRDPAIMAQRAAAAVPVADPRRLAQQQMMLDQQRQQMATRGFGTAMAR